MKVVGKLSEKDYEKLGEILSKKFNIKNEVEREKLFNSLEKADFCILHKNTLYKNVFVKRLFGIMHQLQENKELKPFKI